MGKKREKWKLPKNDDAEKGIPQHIPKKVANQELSKESELKEGKNEKNGKWDLPSDRHVTSSIHKKAKQGNQRFPRKTRTPLQKEGMSCEEKGQRKREKKKRFSREKLSVNLW